VTAGRTKLALLLGGLAAPWAVILFWFAAGFAGTNFLSSPIPWLMMAGSWFVALPVYVFCREWMEGAWWRPFLFASVAVSAFIVLVGMRQVLWHLANNPFAWRIVLGVLTSVWVGVGGFLAVYRLLKDPRD
jgi:hypothetical protein